MFYNWTDEMICRYFDTHWNTSLDKICALSGRSMPEVTKALLIAEPPEHWSNAELRVPFKPRQLTAGDPTSWVSTVWDALHNTLDDGTWTDEQVDEVNTAMAWIAEELGVKQEDV